MIGRINKKLGNLYLSLGILVAAALIAFCNSFTVPFILDDFGSIANNYAIRNLLDPATIWKFYSNRVVLYYTLAVNYAIHDNGVEGYHITNLLIHIFNGFILLLILRKLLSLDYFKEKMLGKYRNLISLACVLIFLTHPLQVNAVTYIVQRTASLAATFYFLAIFCFLKFRLEGKIRYYLLTLLFTVIAMFTKENTITIPFMLAIIELMFFLRDGKTKWFHRILFLFILFLTVPIIPGTNLLLKGYSQSDPGVSFKASTSMDRWQYFYTELNVMIKYIKLLFVPDNLNFDYSNDFPVSKHIWQNGSFYSLLKLAAIGLAAVLCFRRNRLVSLGIVWFFVGLSVESSFISIKDVYFEHRLYYPMAGFTMVLAGTAFAILGWKRRFYLFQKPLLYFLSLSVFFLFMNTAVTLHRNYVYGDEIRLWADVVSKAPRSDRAHSCLATAYLNKYDANNKETAGYLDISEKEFKTAISLYDSNSTAHCNLSKVYLLKGEYQKCIDEANITNRISRSVYAYNNMGNAYLKMNRIEDALTAFQNGYRTDEKCTFIIRALANTYYDNKQYRNARFYYEKLLEVDRFADKKKLKEKLEDIKKKLEAPETTRSSSTVTQ